jgi:hypothetical protein
MKRIRFVTLVMVVALLILAGAGSTGAQQPTQELVQDPARDQAITPEMRVDSATLQQWLHSGDPRLAAWAADFTRRNHDATILAELPSWLEKWPVPLGAGDGKSVSAANAVLDALIQENAPVPVSTIVAIAPRFPAQAAILISRLPLSESRSTLGDWTLNNGGSWASGMLARIALMMLAKDPELKGAPSRESSGVVARTVADSENKIQITVRAAGSLGGGSGGSVFCGDSLERKSLDGWPPIYGYDLVENDSEIGAVAIVELDRDRIVLRRFDENAPLGSCYGVEPLDPVTRHRLIAFWLGKRVIDMSSWQPVDNFTIVWSDRSGYDAELGKIVEGQREKLKATVQTLQQRGYLTESAASALMPRLVVTVTCEIDPCPLP